MAISQSTDVAEERGADPVGELLALRQQRDAAVAKFVADAVAGKRVNPKALDAALIEAGVSADDFAARVNAGRRRKELRQTVAKKAWLNTRWVELTERRDALNARLQEEVDAAHQRFNTAVAPVQAELDQLQLLSREIENAKRELAKTAPEDAKAAYKAAQVQLSTFDNSQQLQIAQRNLEKFTALAAEAEAWQKSAIGRSEKEQAAEEVQRMTGYRDHWQREVDRLMAEKAELEADIERAWQAMLDS